MIRLAVLAGVLLVLSVLQLGGASAARADATNLGCGGGWVGYGNDETWQKINQTIDDVYGPCMSGNEGCSIGDWLWMSEGPAATPECITDDEHTSLVNQDVAAEAEATGNSVPSDIPAADAAQGVAEYDAAAGADNAVKTAALDTLEEAGAWPAIDALGVVPFAAAGAGAFTIGWVVGSQIADLIGVTDSTSPTGSYVPYQTIAERQGTVIDGGSPNAVKMPTDGFLVTWSGGAGHPDALQSSDDMDGDCFSWGMGGTVDRLTLIPPVKTPCNEGQDNDQNFPEQAPSTWLSAYYVPAVVTHLPGPGQGAVAGNQGYNGSGGGMPAPNEATQKTGSTAALGDPNASPWNRYVCQQAANAFCSAITVGQNAPGALVIPAPEPATETYAQYVAQLRKAGFVGTITQSTLDGASADPSLQPNQIVRTSPAENTYAQPSTAITVYTNPDSLTDAPAGGAPGAPTLPGVSIPSASTPCSVFPFGIPCWIVAQLGDLVSTVATAPSFSIGLPSMFGGGHLTVDLDHPFGADLSAIMAVVRVVLLFVSFIGLVLWLGGMAMGGSTGGGGGAAEDEG